MPKWNVQNTGPQWLMDAEGRMVGYRDKRGREFHVQQAQGVVGDAETTSDKLDGIAAVAAASKALVSDAGNLVRAPTFIDKSANLSRVQAVFYKQNEGSGTSLAEDGGDGPAISVTGTTTGAWANAGYFTHDAAGNVAKIANNPYIDGLISMETECSILIGVDLWITAWPSSTESIWALHRDDLSGGGVRFPMASGSAGRFGVYYRSSGGGITTEQTGIALGSYLGQRLSFLTELRVMPSLNELRIYLYINGRMERANTVTLGTPPATDSTGGLYLSGYGSTPLQKLGAGGSGARTANFFCVRHSGADRNIAGRLAAYVAANQALPTWLTRI